MEFCNNEAADIRETCGAKLQSRGLNRTLCSSILQSLLRYIQAMESYVGRSYLRIFSIVTHRCCKYSRCLHACFSVHHNVSHWLDNIRSFNLSQVNSQQMTQQFTFVTVALSLSSWYARWVPPDHRSNSVCSAPLMNPGSIRFRQNTYTYLLASSPTKAVQMR